MASTAERTAPTVIPEAKIEDDNDYDDSLRGQREKDCLIDNEIGDLRVQHTVKDHLDVATQNQLMLEMLIKHQARWNTEQKLEWERMGDEREPMAGELNEQDPKCTKHTKRSIGGPRLNIYNMLDPIQYCGSAKELD